MLHQNKVLWVSGLSTGVKKINHINFLADKKELEFDQLCLKWIMVFVLVRVLWKERTHNIYTHTHILHTCTSMHTRGRGRERETKRLQGTGSCDDEG